MPQISTNQNWVSPSENLTLDYSATSSENGSSDHVANLFIESFDIHENEFFSSLASEIDYGSGAEMDMKSEPSRTTSTSPLFVTKVEPSVESDATEKVSPKQSKPLVWVEQSVGNVNPLVPEVNLVSDNEGASNGVEAVRKRIQKRKSRVTKTVLQEEKVTKKNRNTLAARRYRQKRQEEVEVLDNRVKELEKQLADSAFQAKWWEMEAQRWKKIAEGN